MLSESRFQTVLSNNSREYCGRPDRHLYQLFLQLEEIEHRTTQVRQPQIRRIRPCNGFVERFQRTLLDEYFRIQGRKKFYETLTEMQKDLEVYLVHYNTRRAHQGLNMKGRTPAQAFRDGLPKDAKGGSKKAA